MSTLLTELMLPPMARGPSDPVEQRVHRGIAPVGVEQPAIGRHDAKRRRAPVGAGSQTPFDQTGVAEAEGQRQQAHRRDVLAAPGPLVELLAQAPGVVEATGTAHHQSHHADEDRRAGASDDLLAQFDRLGVAPGHEQRHRLGPARPECVGLQFECAGGVPRRQVGVAHRAGG